LILLGITLTSTKGIISGSRPLIQLKTNGKKSLAVTKAEVGLPGRAKTKVF